MHKNKLNVSLENKKNNKKYMKRNPSLDKPVQRYLLLLPMVYIYDLSVNHLNVALMLMLIIYQVSEQAEAPLFILSFITGTS